MNAFDAQETICYSRTCVATRRNKDVDQPFALFLEEVLQQSSHKASPDVLEGEGRAVKELERINGLFDFYQWDDEGKRVINYPSKALCIHIFAKEAVRHLIGYLLKRHVLYVVEKRLWKGLDALGHIEPSVLGQTFDDSLFECSKWCLAVCAIVSHIFINSLIKASPSSKP